MPDPSNAVLAIVGMAGVGTIGFSFPKPIDTTSNQRGTTQPIGLDPGEVVLR